MKKICRFEIYHKEKALAFGSDHVCGEYLQIWDITEDRMPDEDNILVDEDTKITGMTRDKMMKLIREHGFTEKELEKAYNGEVEIPPLHAIEARKLLLDLDKKVIYNEESS